MKSRYEKFKRQFHLLKVGALIPLQFSLRLQKSLSEKTSKETALLNALQNDIVNSVNSLDWNINNADDNAVLAAIAKFQSDTYDTERERDNDLLKALAVYIKANPTNRDDKFLKYVTTLNILTTYKNKREYGNERSDLEVNKDRIKQTEADLQSKRDKTKTYKNVFLKNLTRATQAIEDDVLFSEIYKTLKQTIEDSINKIDSHKNSVSEMESELNRLKLERKRLIANLKFNSLSRQPDAITFIMETAPELNFNLPNDFPFMNDNLKIDVDNTKIALTLLERKLAKAAEEKVIADKLILLPPEPTQEELDKLKVTSDEFNKDISALNVGKEDQPAFLDLTAEKLNMKIDSNLPHVLLTPTKKTPAEGPSFWQRHQMKLLGFVVGAVTGVVLTTLAAVFFPPVIPIVTGYIIVGANPFLAAAIITTVTAAVFGFLGMVVDHFKNKKATQQVSPDDEAEHTPLTDDSYVANNTSEKSSTASMMNQLDISPSQKKVEEVKKPVVAVVKPANANRSKMTSKKFKAKSMRDFARAEDPKDHSSSIKPRL